MQQKILNVIGRMASVIGPYLDAEENSFLTPHCPRAWAMGLVQNKSLSFWRREALENFNNIIIH